MQFAIFNCFVEFKIYISLKQLVRLNGYQVSFVEFKIYISLKPNFPPSFLDKCFVEFKIYISLKQSSHYKHTRYSFVEFKIYISLKHYCLPFFKPFVLQNSKFTYLSNLTFTHQFFKLFCRIQNLHISQTPITTIDPQ